MSPNLLLDPAGPPGDDQLRAALGPAFPQFAALRDAAPDLERDWAYHGRKYGWKFRVFDEDKSLLELTVEDGRLLVTIAARQAEWQALATEDPALASRLAAAGVAPASYGVKLRVRDPSSCALALALVDFILEQRGEEE